MRGKLRRANRPRSYRWIHHVQCKINGLGRYLPTTAIPLCSSKQEHQLFTCKPMLHLLLCLGVLGHLSSAAGPPARHDTRPLKAFMEIQSVSCAPHSSPPVAQTDIHETFMVYWNIEEKKKRVKKDDSLWKIKAALEY